MILIITIPALSAEGPPLRRRAFLFGSGAVAVDLVIPKPLHFSPKPSAIPTAAFDFSNFDYPGSFIDQWYRRDPESLRRFHESMLERRIPLDTYVAPSKTRILGLDVYAASADLPRGARASKALLARNLYGLLKRS